MLRCELLLVCRGWRSSSSRSADVWRSADSCRRTSCAAWRPRKSGRWSCRGKSASCVTNCWETCSRRAPTLTPSIWTCRSVPRRRRRRRRQKASAKNPEKPRSRRSGKRAKQTAADVNADGADADAAGHTARAAVAAAAAAADAHITDPDDTERTTSSKHGQVTFTRKIQQNIRNWFLRKEREAWFRTIKIFFPQQIMFS